MIIMYLLGHSIPMQIVFFFAYGMVYFLAWAVHDKAVISWKDAAVSYSQTHDQTVLGDYNKQSRIWHFMNAVLSALTGIMVAYLVWGFSLRMLQLFCLFGLIRWIWFDFMLNVLRDLPADYVGTVADTDLLLRGLKINSLVIKGAALLIIIFWILFY